jgi:hypothetical protein
MYDFYSGNLPHIFDTFFFPSAKNIVIIPDSLPKVRTNFGKFNIKFVGPKTWNETDETFKNCNKYKFKKKLKKMYVLFNKRAGVFYSTRPASLLNSFKHDYKFNRYTALLVYTA